MDHLINNADKPIPSPEDQGKAAPAAGDDYDEDDKDALAAHVKKMGGAAGSEDVDAARVGSYYPGSESLS
jgi:hypothetical protein